MSDGIEEAGLVCVLSGVLSEDMKKDVSSFWTIGGEEKPIAPIVSGIAPKVSGIAPIVSGIAPKVSGIARYTRYCTLSIRYCTYRIRYCTIY